VAVPDPLIVVFDVNIYLDAARLVGPPFNMAALSDILAREKGTRPPHPDRRIDSARSLVIARSGILARPQRLQVWTSDHINALVRLKARQPDDEALFPEDRGLGWSDEHAHALLDDLVWPVVFDSAGDTVGDLRYPEHSPPLDHEDGMVFATAKAAADGDVVCDRILVTRDLPFAEKCKALGYPRVMHPSQFVAFTHAARSKVAVTNMRPRPPV
jgi:hypothetical protein